MKLKREHKTALVVITALAFFIWGFNYLKGKDIFKKYHTYYTVLKNVEGIVTSTPITLKGIQIGTVKDMRFVNGYDQTLLVLDVDSDYKIPRDSKVKIYGGNIMGGKNVAIVPGTLSEQAKDGDTLAAQTMPGMFDLVNDKITPLQNKLESILSKTDTLVGSINTVLNPQTQKHLSAGIADLSVTLHRLNKTSETLNRLLATNEKHFNNSVAHLDTVSQNFSILSDSLKNIKVGELANNIKKSIAALNTSLDKLNKGDGTMAKLMNDPKLYQNLENATKELERLLKDLRENPKRYVHFSIWGRKDKKK